MNNFKIMSKLVAIIIAAYVFVSCSILLSSRRDFADIEKGMTKSYIQANYGKPGIRRFDQQLEEWEYVRPLKTCVVVFSGDIVVGLDMFYNDSNQTDSVNDNYCPPHTNRPPSHHVNPDCGEIVYINGRGYRLMSDSSYNMVYRMVSKENFEDRKLKMLKSTFKRTEGYIRPKQCVKLLRLFRFNDTKLKALKVIESRVFANEDLELVFNEFSSYFDREEAKELFFKDYR